MTGHFVPEGSKAGGLLHFLKNHSFNQAIDKVKGSGFYGINDVDRCVVNCNSNRKTHKKHKKIDRSTMFTGCDLFFVILD